MMFINKFIDKVSMIESRQGKDLVLPINDARGLRDEVAKLLNDLNNAKNSKVATQEEPVYKVEIKGGSFK